jgi:hypothetical protein
MGAIDYGSTPSLPFDRSPNPPIWAILPTTVQITTTQSITHILTNCTINHSLVTALANLSLFSLTVVHARNNPSQKLSAAAFSEDKAFIEHSILSFPSTLPYPEIQTKLEIACCMAGLIYMKAILHEFPNSIKGNSILLSRIRDALADVTKEGEEGKEELLIWLYMVGALVSRGEMREWLVAGLRRMVDRMGVESVDDERLLLYNLFDIKGIFGKEVREVWGEVSAF